nr:RNA-directed DNA polymerase, eukaryota [Tanacetum cinerariifolium]
MTSHEDLSPTIYICDEEQAEPNYNGRRCGKHLPRSLNNGVEESDSDVVSDTYFSDHGEDHGLEHQQASIKQDAPEVESDRPPNRSERSNSRVLEEVVNSVDKSSSESINNGIKLKECGSILEILEEMITVGQTMGFSLEGGILCTWDTNFFKKEQHIISDNFVALYGTWIPNRQKLLLISAYAPQSASSKRMLWSYLASLITSCNGERLIMGDFNELEGYSFTWAHPSATKMSLPGFDDLVTKSWNSFVLDDSN